MWFHGQLIPVPFDPHAHLQQRFGGIGGWSEGDAKFTGQNPQGGAVITYYQRSRHLFGAMKLEIFDAQGKLVDTIPASKRRGINRVSWSMRVAAPRTPKAAQVAFNSLQGPRVVPGTYTVRLTKGKQVYEHKVDIGLDRRADFTIADRQAQFDAAMDELARRFKASQAKAVICLLDCCFSGGAPGRVLEDSPATRSPVQPFSDIAGNGRVLFAACNEDETALEDPNTRHGLFTHAVLHLLQAGEGQTSVLGVADEVQRIVLSPTQVRDLAAALNLPEGIYRRKDAGKE